jgi:hypothetical protein
MHATAKNPASNSSSSAVLSICDTPKTQTQDFDPDTCMVCRRLKHKSTDTKLD